MINKITGIRKCLSLRQIFIITTILGCIALVSFGFHPKKYVPETNIGTWNTLLKPILAEINFYFPEDTSKIKEKMESPKASIQNYLEPTPYTEKPPFQIEVLEDFNWIDLAPSYFTHLEGQCITHNGLFYSFGGITDSFDWNADGNFELSTTGKSEVYNPINNEWTVLPDMPLGVSHVGIARIGDDIWIPGGFTTDRRPTDIVQIFNTKTQTWRLGPSLPELIASNGVARLGKQIHLFGGLEKDRATDIPRHYVWDTENPQAGWQQAAPLDLPRNHFSAVTVGGRIYAVGGAFGHDIPPVPEDVMFVHAYDPYLDLWTKKADLPARRSHNDPGTFATSDGKIVTVGGRSFFGVTDGNAKLTMEEVTIYDPELNFWQELGTQELRRLAPNARVINDELYVGNGGARWDIPLSELKKTAFERPKRTELGFWPSKIEIELAPNENHNLKTLLWTYFGNTPFFLNETAMPNWIEASFSHQSTDNFGVPIELFMNTGDLQPGSYEAQLSATAPGYASAQLDIVLNVVPPEQKNNEIWLEAECAQVGSNWIIEKDVTASNGEYVYVKDLKSIGAPPTDLPENRVRFEFNNEVAGNYTLQARILAASSAANSYWARLNEGPWIQWWSGIEIGDKFRWFTLPNANLSLMEGINTIDFAYREPTTLLDKIVLSREPLTVKGLGATDKGCFRSTRSQSSLPKALIETNLNSGTAPLELNLNAFKSTAPNGQIVSYSWEWVFNGDIIKISGPELNLNFSQEGTYTIVLRVEDESGTQSSDMVQIRVLKPGTLEEEIILEAECAEWNGEIWELEPSNLASGGFSMVPKTAKSLFPAPPDLPENRIRFQMDLPQAGTYYGFARILAPSSQNDSYWIRVDEGEWILWFDGIKIDDEFSWNPLKSNQGANKFQWDAGRHTIDIAFREPGAQLDKLILKSENVSPSGLGPKPSILCDYSINLAPNALAGPDLEIEDLGGDGKEFVQLSAANSNDPDGTIIAYRWFLGNELISNQKEFTYEFDLGVQTLRLEVEDNNQAISHTNLNINVVSGCLPPPTPWLSLDLGPVSKPGNVCFQAQTNTFQVLGSGKDIGAREDEGHLMYQTLNCDFIFTARLNEFINFGTNSEAGLMIRSDDSPQAVNAALMLTPQNVLTFQFRETPGAFARSQPIANIAPPQWMRLQKQASLISAFYSPDGLTWTKIAETNLDFPENFLLGLVVSQRNAANQLCLADFGEVKVETLPCNPSSELSINLIDATHEIAVTELLDGGQYPIELFPTFSMDVVQFPEGTRSIAYDLQGPLPNIRVENVIPYTLFGDDPGDYFGETPLPGDYQLRIQVYDSVRAGGNMLLEENYNFAFVTTAQTTSKNTVPNLPRTDENPEVKRLINAYANPLRGNKLVLEFSGAVQEEISLQVFDPSGRLLYNGKAQADAGQSKINIDFSGVNLPSGQVMLLLRGKGIEKRSLKLMISR